MHADYDKALRFVIRYFEAEMPEADYEELKDEARRFLDELGISP